MEEILYVGLSAHHERELVGAIDACSGGNDEVETRHGKFTTTTLAAGVQNVDHVTRRAFERRIYSSGWARSSISGYTRKFYVVSVMAFGGRLVFRHI